MTGVITLMVLALLCAFCIRWVSQRTRMPVPTRAAVVIVFVLVVLALYGQTRG
jgi:uncharacterized membrane protein (DUF4010 family)